MLKALELAGFKSFADRTRFEFPRGVSIVVGPNGSGKSNIVDAVKWALGSQSARSMRGHEMVDVIFNGSASRGPLGTAEVTLTLDNHDRVLAIDAREVHITRRVYRSGEGEYLINRQPCRLRDIRELLAVTGMTTEAYCIIEQGKVDLLLQSSPRERRVIFEEAAGISQFKFKKAAAARRLERVEQNLLRLSDIVDEVESRLRSVRMQAGKARRYRECATRLQHLRTQVGLVDWRALTREITAREAQLAEIARRHAERETAIATLESQAQALEREQEAAARRERDVESQASATRAEIAALEAGIATQSARRADVEQEIDRFRRQLVAMNSRAGVAADPLRDTAARVQAAEAEFVDAGKQLGSQLKIVAATRSELDSVRSALEQGRTRHAEAMRNVALLSNQAALAEEQLRTAQTARDEGHTQLEELKQQHDALSARRTQLQQNEAAAEAQHNVCQGRLRSSENRLAELRRELARVDKQRRQLEDGLTRTRERIHVLTELHKRLEGLNSGVKDLLMAAHNNPEGPLGEIRGVVADLFHVDVDSAPMVDVALGERSQYLVVASAARLFNWLNAKPLGVTGRVGFLRLDASTRRAAGDAMSGDPADQVDLSGEPGVMGRADRFVETAAEFAPLAHRLLGRTWFVDRLSTAIRLAQTAGRGLAFVTSDGELLAADGALVVGPRQPSAGLLSRQSELRACHEQTADLEKQLAHQQSVHARLESDRTDQEQQLTTATAQFTELAARLADHRHLMAATRRELEQTTQWVDRRSSQLHDAQQQIATIEQQRADVHGQKLAAEQAVADLHDELLAAAERASQIEQRLLAIQAAATESQIAAAKCEQRVEILRSQLEQAQRDQRERDAALNDARRRLADREAQLAELDAAMLADRQSLSELFLRKQQHAEELAQFAAVNEQLRRVRTEIHARIRHDRQQLGGLQSQQHKLDIATNKLRHERQTLAERMQDDYGIDLAAAGSTEQGAEGENLLPAPGSPLLAPPRDTVEREIVELRNHLNNLGAVNLDALDELDDLEARFGGLSQQYRDLVDAKASLERIIQRINVESRQLFLATLEVVREHFRELFRRLFGGGEADILLDETEDVLECGIDIVACPPGKEACSISLLSGGEKTLTCVALLLAVFRSKPSPFCILDEVDAALDEANIGRFIQVLREFLSFTQFIVVTHSKKTMSGADTLYGVTMEESGVSKQVSVRFEDVTEDGHILPSGLRAEMTTQDISASDDGLSANRRAA